MVKEFDLTLSDGRTLHVYDSAPGDADRTVVYWQHGTPNLGAPPVPLLPAADRSGIRFVGHDRPGYGGSTPVPGRSVGSIAADARAVSDTLGIDRFAVLGHSGGGPHALACAALLPDRVTAAVSMSGLAPFRADGLDWFAGMTPGGEASLRAAAAGRAAKERHEAEPGDAETGFTADDLDALGGDWAWVLDVVRPALAQGPAALIDDDLGYVAPWGFDPTTITAPVLFVHGTADRIVPSAHSEWLAGRLPHAELRLVDGAGHVSVLREAESALDWLARA